MRRAIARRATHPRAARQTIDAIIDSDADTVNSHEKERANTLISKSESEMLKARSCSWSWLHAHTAVRARRSPHTHCTVAGHAFRTRMAGRRQSPPQRHAPTHHARPRTLPAAWLLCSTGASRDTALEREALT